MSSVISQLRTAYATKGTDGRNTAEKIIAWFPTCPIPEVARLGRTLRQWRQQVLAYFTSSGVSNGGTEAINLLIEKTRRLTHGFRNFDNYRLRILLVADGSRPYRNRANHAQRRRARKPSVVRDLLGLLHAGPQGVRQCKFGIGGRGLRGDRPLNRGTTTSRKA